MLETISVKDWLSIANNNKVALEHPLVKTLSDLLNKLNSNNAPHAILDISQQIISLINDNLINKKTTIIVYKMLLILKNNCFKFLMCLLNLNTTNQVEVALINRATYKSVDPQYLPNQIIGEVTALEENTQMDRKKFLERRLKFRFQQISQGRIRFLNFSRDIYRNEFYNRDSSSTKYLSFNEREKYRVFISKGSVKKLVIQRNTDRKISIENYDTSNELSHEGSVGFERAIFVMNTRGEIFSASKIRNVLQHSSFVSGASVLFAGIWQVKQGKILELRNYSGHYLTTLMQMIFFIEYLESNDVDLSLVKISRVYDVMNIVRPLFITTSLTQFRHIMELHKDKITSNGQVLPPTCEEEKQQLQSQMLVSKL